MRTEMELPKMQAVVRPWTGKKDGPLLGFAELVVADTFVIKDIRILMSKADKGPAEPFVSFPSRKGSGPSQDRWFDIAHPITAQARARATAVILAAYGEAGRSGR